MIDIDAQDLQEQTDYFNAEWVNSPAPTEEDFK